MKKAGTTIKILSCLVILVSIIHCKREASLSETEAGKVSRPFEYKGYSSPEYKSYVKSSQYVSMFDGTKIAVDVYLPSDGPKDRSYPVLFTYHPYKRATIDPKTGIMKHGFPGMERFIKYFSSYGFGIVIADMRGSGASFGSRLDVSPQLARDGKQLIDWMEAQTWCNGNVGMFGGSYLGWSQFAVAGEKPRALKAIMPEVVFFDSFSNGTPYAEGILNRTFIKAWPPIQILMDRAAYIPTGERPLLPAAPVIDEDGDGELADEIPLDQNSNIFFIDDPPTYSDGAERRHIYYNAIKEHLSNRDMSRWAPAAPFRNSRIEGTAYTWTDLGPSYRPARIAETGIAVYNVGAWFDTFTRDTTRWFATLKETNPSKMFIHPSLHSSPDLLPALMAGPYWGYFGEDQEQFAQRMLKERLRFFDRYLKGIENRIETDPPVLIFVMNGEGWRTENEWPLARQVVSNYFLNDGYSLSPVRASAGADIYEADLSHDSRYGGLKVTRWGAGILDKPMKRTQKDQQCLTYTTDLLGGDTEVTGHPIVHLWVSSTADHGDIFVYLEDVDERGEAYYVTEGKLRAGFASLVPDEEILPEGVKIDVLPDLPYHGFKDTDYVDGIFASGNVIELVLDLYPTSWVFKRGHRIRISIACADWPTFDLHPKLSQTNKPKDPNNIVPTITVYRDAGHPSRIELPVIPPKS